MEKPWLDMRGYGLHLFMARDSSNPEKHELVIAGPGIERNKQKLITLGFKRDERFVHREYWTRPLAGMTHGIIQKEFDRAPLVYMAVENIMPAIRALRASAAAATTSVTKPETTNGTEFDDARGIPEPASGRPDDAGNGGAALLGEKDPRTVDGGESEDADSAGGDEPTETLSVEATQRTERGSDEAGAPVAVEQPDFGSGESPNAGELDSPFADGRSGDTDQRDIPEPEPDGIGNGGESAEVAPTAGADEDRSVESQHEVTKETTKGSWADDSEREAPTVDRVWRGLTRQDFAAAAGEYTYPSLITPFEALRNAEQDGLSAIPARQKRGLTTFKGWGGIYQNVRTDNSNKNKNATGNQLARSLDMESGDYNETIAQNRLESYYTPYKLTQKVWDIVEHAGVNPSGRFLEPGCGAAHFFANAPESVQRHGTLVGVECDPIAMRFARVIAPDAHLVEDRFENVGLSRDFDAVIGNVPFGETKVFDRRYPKATHVHDYFILRSLDHLKPGGVMAVLTSSGTMDKASSVIREQIMERADLIAGFRLPETIFEDQNASVTTDLLVFQKRPPGTQPNYDFTQTVTKDFNFRGETVQLSYNKYFKDFPENIIGELVVNSGQFGPSLATASSKAFNPIMEQLSERIQDAIPAGIALRTAWQPIADQPMPSRKSKGKSDDLDVGYLQGYRGFVGDYVIHEGKVVEVLDAVDTFDDAGIRNGKKHLIAAPELSERNEAIVRDYIPLRDAARSLIQAQLEGTDDDLASAQASAKALYDDFVEKYGPVNGAASKGFIDDAGAAEVLALELWNDEEDKIDALSDVFTKRVVRANPDGKVENATDAFYVCFDKRGKVDLDYMSEISGIEKEELIADLRGSLIFKDHESGDWVSADNYLSGNVVLKLKQVEATLSVTDEFRDNFKALLDAQPKLVPFGDIAINLGANWIPGKEVRAFVSSLFKKVLHENDFKARYSEASGQWSIDVSNAFKRDFDAERGTIYGNERASFEVLLEKLMNGQRPTHTYKDEDGKVHVDGEATAKSRAKQDELNDRFYSWVCADPERAERFATLYNEKCNVIRLPKPDGSRLTFPGLAPSWQPMPHQYNMVARAMMGFNQMAAHPVGAGKTFEMVAMSMKLKQVGMQQKPMIAVPNHMLGQIAREAKQMYPGARILMVTNEDLHTHNRRRFLAIARNNDWDIVVCTHSLLNQIKAPLDIQLQAVEKQIMVCEAKLSEADSRRLERTLAARLNTLKSERTNLIDIFEKEKERDSIITLESLGVDGLCVDEAHLYKNLALNSSLNVLGVTTGGSNRAANMANLVEYLRQYHGKSFGANFFTGTPISNSMCELYVHNRILRPEMLDDLGIGHFDEWAKRFGRVVSNLEALPEGNGFRVNERFAQFINTPEMIKLFRTFADVKSKTELNLPTPEVHTKIVPLEPTEWQKLFMEHLTMRAVDVRNGAVKPFEDNMLSIATAGRKAALDMQLIHPKLPTDSSAKIAMVAANVFDEAERHADIKGTQLVFMDLGTPGKDKDFSCYEKLKELLVDKGMKANEIAFIHDAKNNDAKEAIFAKVRSGEIRVLVGSTEKMGVGTNVQDRLCALHNVDCPWRPSDIEQRIGRIARRGNLYFSEVNEYRYTTVGSFDLFLWETNKRKQDFITQALIDPDNASREMSEEMDMGHAEVMAVTTGEPKIREKVQVDDKVAKLTRAKQHWEGDRINRYSAANRYNRELKQVEERIALEEKVRAALPGSLIRSVTVRGSITGLQEGDTTWLYAQEVGEAIQARAPVLEARLMRSNEQLEPLKMNVGEIEIVLEVDNRLKETALRGTLDGALLPVNRSTLSKNTVVLGRSVREWFGTDERMKVLMEEKARLLKSLDVVGAVDFNEKWAHESELEELMGQKQELDTWFAAQDFNKTNDGPDPFLMELEAYLAKLEGPATEDKLESFNKEQLAGDLFSEQDNYIEQHLVQTVKAGLRMG